jgi:hypothetical protein
VRPVLEVILKNLRGQGGGHFLSVRFHGAYDFSAANYFGGRKPGDFGGQDEIDLELHIRRQKILRLE